MARFSIMTLSPAAAERVRALVSASSSPVEGVRVGVKKGGCAGMEYTIALADAAKPGEDVVEQDGAKVFVAPEAVLFLLGTRMDYEETILRSGFVFNNPNQTSACGCGESVELKPADAARLQSA